MLSVNQLLHACLLTKWKKCNILSLFLQIHIVESTIPRRSSVPLSLQKGAAYGMLPICKAFVCLPFYKRLFHIPLQSSWGGTRPLSVSSSSILSFIQTYNILLSTSRQQRPGCQQYGNQRFHNSMDLQPMTTSPCRHSPLLSRTGNVSHAFLFLAFLFLHFRKVEEV